MTFHDLAALALPRLSDPLFLGVGIATTLLIGFSKGAFGGGLAILGVPLLSLVMDAPSAAIVVAPLVSLMDMVTLRSFGRATWSVPDLSRLLPGLLLGIGIGWAVFESVRPSVITLLIACITLGFTLHWFLRGRHAPPRQEAPDTPLALIAGTASGFTTFVAHAGGPPIAIYLLRRGLGKSAYTGTTTAFFTLGNLIKLVPYLMLGWARPQTLADALVLAPAVPFGVLAGVFLHRRLEQHRLFFWCYLLLFAAALKMVADALGLMR